VNHFYHDARIHFGGLLPGCCLTCSFPSSWEQLYYQTRFIIQQTLIYVLMCILLLMYSLTGRWELNFVVLPLFNSHSCKQWTTVKAIVVLVYRYMLEFAVPAVFSRCNIMICDDKTCPYCNFRKHDTYCKTTVIVLPVNIIRMYPYFVTHFFSHYEHILGWDN